MGDECSSVLFICFCYYLTVIVNVVVKLYICVIVHVSCYLYSCYVCYTGYLYIFDAGWYFHNLYITYLIKVAMQQLSTINLLSLVFFSQFKRKQTISIAPVGKDLVKLKCFFGLKLLWTQILRWLLVHYNNKNINFRFPYTPYTPSPSQVKSLVDFSRFNLSLVVFSRFYLSLVNFSRFS